MEWRAQLAGHRLNPARIIRSRDRRSIYLGMNRFLPLLIIHPGRYFYQSPLSITSRVIPIFQRLTIPAKSSNLVNLDGENSQGRYETVRSGARASLEEIRDSRAQSRGGGIDSRGRRESSYTEEPVVTRARSRSTPINSISVSRYRDRRTTMHATALENKYIHSIRRNATSSCIDFEGDEQLLAFYLILLILEVQASKKLARKNRGAFSSWKQFKLNTPLWEAKVTSPSLV